MIGHLKVSFSLAIASSLVAAGLAMPAASTPSTAAPPAAPASLTTGELRAELNSQDLPETELLPVTADSHPFNGALWQNKPIDLSRYGYVENEYLLSGESNVYGWTPSGGFETSVLRSGDYTTRMLVRRPKNMKKWSGKVNVEIINMTAGYDWTAVWSALWERTIRDGDVYVGVTSKPNVLEGMKRFDPDRYAELSWDNPLPPGEQACGTLPGQPGYNPNLSRLYENGLAWDMFTQTGRLLKSRSTDNPLGSPAKQVVLSGESQSANYLLTYYRFFTPAATLPNDRPIFDGYFAEAGPLGSTGTPINQCAAPLALDDNQRVFPDRSVPWADIYSQYEYDGIRRWDAPPDSNTSGAKHVFWEVAGSNHGWEWQYLYGDANAEDLIAAGFSDPATYAWSCGPNNPEVPLYMSEKALFVQLKQWIETGKAPTPAPRILHEPVVPGDNPRVDDKTIYDGLNNAMGGIRFPMVEAPVASFGIGKSVLSGDCPEIVPFDAATLDALYPSRRNYLEQYDAATDLLLRQGFILKEDAEKLRTIAREVTSVG
jgi:hypothetical protein